MAVAITTLLRPTPGKQQQHQQAFGQTLQHLKRIGGARTHAFQALVAGPNTGVVGLVTEFDDLNGFAAWWQKAQQDQQLQQHLSQGASSATGASTLTNRVLYVETGTAVGLRSLGEGSVMLSTQLQVAPGKQQEAQQLLSKGRTVLERYGSQTSVWQTVVGGAATGLLLAVNQLRDLHAYAELVGKLRADSEWQQLATQVGGASSPYTIASRSLWTEMAPQG